MSTNEPTTQDSIDTEQTILVAGDEGEILTEPRPEECSCAGLGEGLPCFACHLAGFDDVNPNAGEE
jgi:hypothetical protein